MGNKYVVAVWIRAHGDFEYEDVYRGESFLEAMWALFQNKGRTRCVKFEWRG